jgi:8-amino-7-oxononanoate synthase
MLCLCSNNYLGLATHRQVIEASCSASQKIGCSATGSRLLSGNLTLHQQLEKEIAAFKGTPTALLFNSGYVANLSLLSALTQEGDRVVCDKLNHASIIDGARFSQAEVRYYRHGDLDRAKRLLEKKITGQRFIVTEGVFSMDGDITQLPELLELARHYEAVLILDEAHATGVLGAQGKGTFEHFGLSVCNADLPAVIQMGTLGKALGSFGAFVACDDWVRAALINFARPLIFSTALPPPALSAALAALTVLKETPELVNSLRKKSKFFRETLQSYFTDCFPVSFSGAVPPSMALKGETPIIPLHVGDASVATQISEELYQRGIYGLPIRPPTVPPGGARIRFTLMATHQDSDLEKALKEIVSTAILFLDHSKSSQ